jgi:hypothetical protein
MPLPYTPQLAQIHNQLIFKKERNLALQWNPFWHTTLKNYFMTRIITFATALLLTLSSFARSADSISGDIKTSFKRSFRTAQLMSTETHEAFTKLTFKMNNAVMFAFYSRTGDLLAVTRNIVSTQLPMNLLMSLKNNYSDYWITELFEFNGNDNSCYYVSLESADAKVTLRSIGDSWEVYSSVKKDLR